MKLWLIRPVDGDPAWEPWYDKAFGFVVRSETEDQARAFAVAEGGDEQGYAAPPPDSPWLDPQRSTCVELTAEGDEGVVIRDFAAA